MTNVRPRRLAVLSTMTLTFLMFAGSASAAPVELFTASDFYIPRPAAVSDQVGVRRPITTFDLAANGHADLIGQECRFSVSADNGDSIHLDNYAVLITGGVETDVIDTESLANVTTTTLEIDTLIMGPTIEFFNVMLPDPSATVGTSVDFTVSADCSPIAATTTTVASTTTTAPTTSTTVPPTTTTAPPSPTSTGGSVGPTTTQPQTTTTALATTSTSDPLTSTELGSSTTVPPVTGGTLPFTGPDGVAGLTWSATALLIMGGWMVVAARPRGRHSA